MQAIESGKLYPKRVIILTGANIAASRSAMPSEARNDTCTREETLPPTTPPRIRPHIIRNQYAAQTDPAIAPPT